MSTTTAPPRVAAETVRRRVGARPWVGTGTLFRLNLRLDRVRILIWAAALGLITAGTVAALVETYPDAAARQARAALMSNPSAVMMSGPAFGLEDYTVGAMVANEISLTLLVAAAIMSVLLVTRHTRAEEESGRAEVVRALPVGRFAPAAAAVLAVAVANAAVAAAIVLALVGAGLEGAGSLALGGATALTGLVFGAVAAVTAQLSAHARAASGLALAVLGAAFLIRGVGDIIAAQGSWLSWFSPIAWAQQTRVYVDLRWWPLALSAATIVVLLTLAVALAQRRDLGAGLAAPRPGARTASPRLTTVPGLALRLLRGTFLGWTVALVVFGVTFGTLANTLEDAVADIPDLADFIAVDLTDLTTSFAAVMVSFLVFGVLAFAVSAVLRLRAEEEAGRGELVISTGTGRLTWLGAWLAVAATQVVVMLLLSGLATGLGIAAVTGEAAWAGRLAVAALAYLPAVTATAAVAVALLGLAPRWAALAWVPVAWIVLVGWLGGILGLPDWAVDLSPVAYTPLVPSEDLALTPLVVLTAVTVALTAAGVAGLRRRDLGT